MLTINPSDIKTNAHEYCNKNGNLLTQIKVIYRQIQIHSTTVCKSIVTRKSDFGIYKAHRNKSAEIGIEYQEKYLQAYKRRFFISGADSRNRIYVLSLKEQIYSTYLMPQ